MGERWRARELLAWLKGLMTSLMPKQKMEGDGGVMIGKVDGCVSQVTHNVSNVTHQHFYGPLQRQDADAAVETKSGGIATYEQRQVLLMIRRVRNSDAVFAFMERTFGTRMVIDLQPSQLARVRRYVETIQRRTGGSNR